MPTRITSFTGASIAGSATLIANGGMGGGFGGQILFFGNPTGGTARVEVFGNGALDISGLTASSFTIGSIEGSGNVFLGAKNLTVGGNNLSTAFSGVIQDGGQSGGRGGSLTQSGIGTLTLASINTYSGGTTIMGGTLRTQSVSALGSGPVAIKGGSLALDTSLNVASVAWSAGIVQLTPAAGAVLNVTNTFHNGGTGGAFVLDTAGIAEGAYTLATFGTTDFTLGNFSVQALNPSIQLQGTLVQNANNLQYTTTGATASGSLLENGEPTGIPTFADFTVTGLVTTGATAGGNSVNSLIFTPGSSLQIFNTLTLTLGKVTDGGGTSTITGGTLSSPNGFLFNLIGQMFVESALQGDVTKTGSGSLFLNGALFGNAQVLQGLLGGTGSISGNLSNNGTVSPGDAPGTMSIAGNYAQSSTAALVIGVGGRQAGQFDVLAVGGKASLSGTLQLVQLNNFNLQRGDLFTFLTAGQGVTGTFSTIINPFVSQTILQPEVVYGANSVALEMVQGSFEAFAKRIGLPPNETAVASALDKAAFDPRANNLIAYLDNRTLTKLPGDLASISPEALTSIYQIGTSFANVQSLNLQRRAEDIRSGANGFSAASFSMNGDNPSYSGGMGFAGPAGPAGLDDKESKVAYTPTPDGRWGAFLSGTGQWVKVSDTEDARGYDLQTGGFTLGMDYKVTPNLAIGVSAGYAGTGVDLANNGRVLVNGGKFGVYGTYFTGGFYTDAAINGGYNSYSTYRNVLNAQARGDAEGGELNAFFGTGYDFKKGALTFGPTATFNYTNVRLNGFTENGSLAPLDIHGGNGESLRSAFGAKASYEWKVGKVIIKPEIRAAWQHEYGDTTYALDSSFANGAGNVFTTSGPKLGRDSLLVSAGFAVQFNERVSAYVYYDGELARTNYQSNSVSGGCRIAF